MRVRIQRRRATSDSMTGPNRLVALALAAVLAPAALTAFTMGCWGLRPTFDGPALSLLRAACFLTGKPGSRRLLYCWPPSLFLTGTGGAEAKSPDRDMEPSRRGPAQVNPANLTKLSVFDVHQNSREIGGLQVYVGTEDRDQGRSSPPSGRVDSSFFASHWNGDQQERHLGSLDGSAFRRGPGGFDGSRHIIGVCVCCLESDRKSGLDRLISVRLGAAIELDHLDRSGDFDSLCGSYFT